MSARARIAFLAAVAALVLFSRAGDGLLANYDDCYYAQKAKEMLGGGDWLTPHFAGTVRLDNPPLFIWLVAAGFKLFGIGKYGAVFFPALSAVGCVLLVIRLARRLGLDAFEGWCAATVLLTTQYFLKYAGHAMMDVVLTFLFLAGIDGYLDACEGKRRGWVQVGVATALGVLMKSVLGLFPLVVVVLHRVVERRLRALGEPGPWIAGVVAVALAAPWFVYQLAEHREIFLGEHVRWLIWNRGFTDPAREGIRDSALGYLYGIGKLYWPWLPLAVAGIGLAAKRAIDRSATEPSRSTARLLLLWLLVVLGTMSLGHVKKLWYVMSVFPCLALLAAWAAGHFVRSEEARRRTIAVSAGVLATLAAVVALLPFATSRPRDAGLHALARTVHATVPQGQKVVNLDTPYWDVANLFLFYSDHDLTEPLGEPARVRERLAAGEWALIADQRVDDVAGKEPHAVRVAARAGGWALMTGAGAAPVVLTP